MMTQPHLFDICMALFILGTLVLMGGLAIQIREGYQKLTEERLSGSMNCSDQIGNFIGIYGEGRGKKTITPTSCETFNSTHLKCDVWEVSDDCCFDWSKCLPAPCDALISNYTIICKR